MLRLIITTLAEYQTRFWVPVGLELQRRGHSPRFISFDGRSNEMLAAAGLDYVDATASACAAELDRADPAEVCRRFGMDRLNFWLNHEKIAFGLSDSDALLRKVAGTLLVADRAFASLPAGTNVAMVQELGGFLSVIGSYFSARQRGIVNWFIEPSFFRGRFLLTPNSFGTPRISNHNTTVPPPPECRAYLDETLASGAIVVPKKDEHHYSSAISKIANARNARRLLEKFVDKHLFGKEQEFGHIGQHVRQHARMLVNSRRLRRAYTRLEGAGRFLYYPFHVPGDVALTLRAPEYFDQLALVDYLCRIAPDGVRVAVKEHPAMIGAIDARRLLALSALHDNLTILPPSTNNYRVLRKAEAIVTVNSKSGAEAGLVGKPVLVLGDAFYRDAPFATPVQALSELASTLNRSSARVGDTDATHRWFGALWRQTYPGELYVVDADNIQTFAASLTTALDQRSVPWQAALPANAAAPYQAERHPS